jgi:hypothetical protein
LNLPSFVLDESGAALRLNQVISLVNATYKYSLAKGSEKADKYFSKWLVGRRVLHLEKIVLAHINLLKLSLGIMHHDPHNPRVFARPTIVDVLYS